MSHTIPQEMQTKLGSYSKLPSVPQIVVKIRQVSEDPRSSAADLANCILSDHQLTARILRTANSTYYGSFAGKINTVTHAIVLMGFRAVHNIAISMAVYEVVNHVSDKTPFDRVAFWTRSLASGVIAKYIAHEIRQEKLIEVAFIAGFLHDIGQAVLAGLFPEKYEKIAQLDPDCTNIWETERVLLGTDHCEVGGFLAEKWNLPRGLVRAIKEHHRTDLMPEERSSHLVVDLVYLADMIRPFVMASANPDSAEYREVIGKAHRLVNISQEAMVNLLSQCRGQVADIAQDLHIDIHNELEPAALTNTVMAEMQQQLTAQEIQLAFLRNATGALLEAKKQDEILQVVCEAVYRGLQMGRVVVFEHDARQSSFVGNVGFGFESQQAVQALKFTSRSGFFQQIHQEGRPLSYDGEGAAVRATTEELNRLETRAFIAVPIAIVDEVKFVVFADASEQHQPIDDNLLASIMSLASQAAVVLERNFLRAKLGRL